MLRAYIRGKKTDAQLGEWLALVDCEDDIPASEKDQLALVRLLAIEFWEGMRPKQELLDEISKLLLPTVRRRTTRVKN